MAHVVQLRLVEAPHSLSLKQRQAFILCKLLIKETIAKLLINKPSLQHIKLISSYEIQTSFFWLCEEKMTWGNIFEGMSDIIAKLLYFCRQKYLPDYFIYFRNNITAVIGDMYQFNSVKSS